MCGIVGYIGENRAREVLINGLLSLEYRGYDSAGIAVLGENKIIVKKEKGRVENLKKIEGYNQLEGNIGIAHTRWATHGEPSKINAHPHLDNSQTFAVVHNGIIENYSDIKAFLVNNGYNFISQTDTEVIPNLISFYYKELNNLIGTDRLLNAVSLALKKLKGSYAIEVISTLYPENIVVARKSSPLVIGNGENEKFIASDIPAVLSYTKEFYFLDDEEIALIGKNTISFYDISLNKHEKNIENIEYDVRLAQKQNYKDFMIKEIFEQPDVIKKTIDSRISIDRKCCFDDIGITKEYLENIRKIYIVACGTAKNAGLVGKKIIEKLTGIYTEVDIASEFRYRNPIIDDKTLFICISQSGETADTLAALKLAKSNGAKTIGIVNAIGSSITREADYSIYTYAGPEIAVASTKAYTSQVVLLSILGIYFAEILGTTKMEYLENLKKDIISIPGKIEEILKNASKIEKIANMLYDQKDMFFIGRGNDYNLAEEASLKVKEVSYIHSEAYPAGELKHGSIALIEKNTAVIGIITDSNLYEKTLSNIEEVISRGAKVLLVTNQNIENKQIENIIDIPKIDSLISPVLAVIPMQLLAYYISQFKGLDSDKPRNLAKSVTVE